MGQAGTLILGREDIARALTLRDCIEAVEGAFGRWARAGMAVPGVVHIAAPDGAFHVKSAAFTGEPHYVAVKVNGNFPGNPGRNGLPTIQGAIVLSDGRNGSLLAVMDSTEVTAMRTGAATAVAARYLARPDSRSATIIGCGIQGRVQLKSLIEVLPLETVYAHDADGERSARFASELGAETGIEIVAVDDFAEGTRASQVIVTCTSSRRAFLSTAHVRPGTFVAAVGADNHDKQELDPALLARATVVVDSIEQCAAIGDLHHALESGAMTQSDVYAELGAIVAGRVKPELDAEDIVIFDSTGSAIQDVAAAAVIFERARSQRIGQMVKLC